MKAVRFGGALGSDFQIKIILIVFWPARGPRYQDFVKISKAFFGLKYHV